MFAKKTLLITGGTGSFGNAVLRRFLKTDIAEIRIFSRDEKKQEDVRKRYNNRKLRFYIGDVRDYASVAAAMKKVDYVFNAAALKQVPSCEFFPLEAVRTNVIGADNVIEAAANCGVSRIVCLSTDKAVYPINAMGMSKALMEKLMIARSRNLEGTGTTVFATRYGNVMASRGSVIPLFVNQVLAGQPLTVTDPNMTRFMMSLEDAVDLVLFAFQHGSNGDIFVQKSPASTIGDLARSIVDLLGKPKHPIRIIGTRHGEKVHETLLSREETVAAEDLGQYFRVRPDARELDYDKYFVDGGQTITEARDYNSHNTRRLNIEETKELLLKLDFIRDIVAGKSPQPVD